MISEKVKMELVVKRKEKEEIMIEENIIKRLRKRLKVMMREEKQFKYIMMKGGKREKGILKNRGESQRKGEYLGKFDQEGDVGRKIKEIKRDFLMRK